MYFLTTRVKQPNMDNYKKLMCCIRYIRDTVDRSLLFDSSKVRVNIWWVNAAYRVHLGMKSHSGVIISLGKEVVHINSIRQKLNIGISMESDIFGIIHHMYGVLWSM